MDGTSALNTDGSSLNDHGSHENQGGSFAGQGGHCGKNFADKTYGQFDRLPDVTKKGAAFTGYHTIGTVGMKKHGHETAGGGRIHIEIDSIQLEGQGRQLKANGAPLKETKLD